jgi:transposase
VIYPFGFPPARLPFPAAPLKRFGVHLAPATRGHNLHIASSLERRISQSGRRAPTISGDTVPVIIDRLTGQVRAAQIFVAVLGASNFIYAKASWTQTLADWIGAHTRAFAALGGVPKLLVPVIAIRGRLPQESARDRLPQRWHARIPQHAADRGGDDAAE